MKKLAILFTTLVLGSTAAMAAPGYSAPAAPYAAQVRDHRMLPVRQHTTWSTLSYGSRLSRGASLIDVSSTERFSKLQLSASGSLFLDKVVITFANGRTQLVNLDKRLGRGATSVAIDLEGNARRIDKIAVYGRGGMRSSIKVMAI
ncbi:MAG: hypothetical protein ABI867_10460 [Kofleriaceae bacterium]